MTSFTGEYFTTDYFYRKEAEKKTLRKIGALCGIALLGYVLIQNVLALGIQAVGLWDKYTTDKFFQSGADIFLTFAGLLLPFSVISRIIKKHSGIQDPLLFSRKVSKGALVGAVVSGVGLCMEANLISSVFITFMDGLGFSLTSPDVPMAQGSSGFFLSFVRVAVVAAMAEELSLRGYVMGNLKKYGDIFAISVTAVLFAIMHGNLIQAPFALIAGFAIGYFTVKTGTLWTGILIHGANNFISLVLSYIMEIAGQQAGAAATALTVYALGTAGIIGTVLFVKKNKNNPLFSGDTVLSPGEKISGFFFNIPMVLAFLLMLYVTSNYVTFGR